MIDTSRYYLRKEIDDDVVTIGWVGRWSSSFYLESLVNVFERIYRNFAKVIFKFVGAAPFDYPSHLPIEFIPWRLETEIEDLIPFDIGIMPLADDIYAKGKCGFKLLQYMALGIPSIASPVGVNQEIITDGENGFLATSENEWFEKLSLLISNKKRRKMVGIAARETVEERYSLNNALPLLITIFHELTT